MIPFRINRPNGKLLMFVKHGTTSHMSEQSGEKGFLKKHLKAEAAGVGLVVTAAATAVVVRAIRNNRSGRFKNEALMSDMSNEEIHTSLEALNDERLKPASRELELTVAARIYIATHNNTAHVITQTTLLELTESDSFMLGAVLKDLEEQGLVGQRPSDLDNTQTGYFAEDPLSLAGGDDDTNSVPGLLLAVATIMSEVNDAVLIETELA
jgi:hypothetical protein